MNLLVNALIEWPRSVARHLVWLGPLFARVVTGWVFLWTGWGKLTHLPLVAVACLVYFGIWRFEGL